MRVEQVIDGKSERLVMSNSVNYNKDVLNVCVIVCNLCFFLEAGRKQACFTSAFHQASTL